MGLDMYLERYPRYKWYGPRDINLVEEYAEWKKSGDGCSFKEWSGQEESALPKAEDLEYLMGLIETRYWAWDDGHQFPHERIYEQVAYWRKANAIHKWFVDNVQDGKDDCRYHREVTERDLEKLRDACKEVIESAVLIKGKVKNGERIKDGKWEPIYQDGLLVANPEVCHKILPCEDGFFFGSTEYNEWYMNDIKNTYIKAVELLEQTDFEKQRLFYCSSW